MNKLLQSKYAVIAVYLLIIVGLALCFLGFFSSEAEEKKNPIVYGLFTKDKQNGELTLVAKFKFNHSKDYVEKCRNQEFLKDVDAESIAKVCRWSSDAERACYMGGFTLVDEKFIELGSYECVILEGDSWIDPIVDGSED